MCGNRYNADLMKTKRLLVDLCLKQRHRRVFSIGYMDTVASLYLTVHLGCGPSNIK